MPCSFWAASHRWWWAVKTWSLRGLNNRALWDNRVWLWGKWKFRPWPLKKKRLNPKCLAAVLHCCLAAVLHCCVARLCSLSFPPTLSQWAKWRRERRETGDFLSDLDVGQIWDTYGYLKMGCFAPQNMMNSFGSQSLRVSSWWHYFWHTCRNDRCWPTALTLRCLTLSDLVSLELRFDNVLNTLGMHKWLWNDMVWVKIPLVCLPKMNEHDILKKIWLGVTISLANMGWLCNTIL